jgi:hypothetical protein
MSWNLHVGKVYQIEYDYPGMCGSDAQETLYDIFSMFDIETTAEDCYDEEYEVEREELRRLRTIITEEGEEFREQAEEFEKTLSLAELTKDRFIQVLDNLINDSDQKNSCVLLSWF